MEIKYLVSLVILFVSYQIVQHERQKYFEYFHECKLQQRSDQNLLNRDVCMDAEDRVQFKGSVDCEGAEKRLRLSPEACAGRKWRESSQVMHLWSTMTGSYWSIMGWVIPIIAALAWFIQKSQKDDKMVAAYERTIATRTGPGPIMRITD